MSINWIRHYRERAGFTQEELASKADTSAQQISRLEKSERKLSQDWMEKLAPLLNVQPIDLIQPPKIDTQDRRDLEDLPSEELLMRLWGKLSPGMKEAVLTIIEAYATDISEVRKANNV